MMEHSQITDGKAGKLGVILGRDGVTRTRIAKTELTRLLKYSQDIKADCDCGWTNCKTCRAANTLKYYTTNYRILKALVDELSELKGMKEPDPKATLEEIANGIFRLHFEDSEEMCSTFLRFQEHYESPKFAGKFFDFEEFKKWYQDGEEEFTYYHDWAGFNIPSWVLEPFLGGKFDPLSHQEQWFLQMFRWRREKDKLKRFYIIGTAGEGDEALQHEIAHGLYYVNPEYKAEVQAALANLQPKKLKEIKEYLAVDYHQNSLEDEVHAYTLEKLVPLPGIKATKNVKSVSENLNEIYNRYWEKLKH